MKKNIIFVICLLGVVGCYPVNEMQAGQHEDMIVSIQEAIEEYHTLYYPSFRKLVIVTLYQYMHDKGYLNNLPFLYREFRHFKAFILRKKVRLNGRFQKKWNRRCRRILNMLYPYWEQIDQTGGDCTYSNLFGYIELRSQNPFRDVAQLKSFMKKHYIRINPHRPGSIGQANLVYTVGEYVYADLLNTSSYMGEGLGCSRLC